MSFWTLLLPNLTITLVSIVLIILGIGGLYLSAFLPVSQIKRATMTWSALSILAGIIFLFAGNFIFNLFNEFMNESIMVALTVFGLMVIGFLLFSEPKKVSRRKKR